MGMMVVKVRRMRMAVCQRHVVVRMSVWHAQRPEVGMFVLVMDVVPVPMVMVHGQVRVLMRVDLRQVQPHPGGHAQSRDP